MIFSLSRTLWEELGGVRMIEDLLLQVVWGVFAGVIGGLVWLPYLKAKYEDC